MFTELELKKVLSRRWIKIFSIIIGLTVLFIIDDILILLLIGELRIWNIPTFVYFIISIIALFLNVSLAIVVYRVLKKKPSTGIEGMIGKIGFAIENFDGSGKISVKGEIWQAESDAIIQKGEKVQIVEISGLTLKVIQV